MEEIAVFLKILVLVISIIVFFMNRSEKKAFDEKRDEALSARRDEPLNEAEREAVEKWLEQAPTESTVYYLCGDLAYIDLNEVEGIQSEEERPVLLINEQPVLMSTVALACAQREGNMAEVVKVDDTLVLLSLNDRYRLVDEQQGVYPEGMAVAENGMLDTESLVADEVEAEVVYHRMTVEKVGERQATPEEIEYLTPRFYAMRFMGWTILVAIAYLIVAGYGYQTEAGLVAVCGVLLGYVFCRRNGRLKEEDCRVEIYRGAIHSMSDSASELLVAITEDDRQVALFREYQAPLAWQGLLQPGTVGRFDVCPSQGKMLAFGPHRAIDVVDESPGRLRQPKHLTMMFSIVALILLAAYQVYWPWAKASVAMQMDAQWRTMAYAGDWQQMPKVGDTLVLDQPKFCEQSNGWVGSFCYRFHVSTNADEEVTFTPLLLTDTIKARAGYFLDKPNMLPQLPDEEYLRLERLQYLYVGIGEALRPQYQLYWFTAEDLVNIANHVDKFCHYAEEPCDRFRAAFAPIWQAVTEAECDKTSCWQQALANEVPKETSPTLENIDTASVYRQAGRDIAKQIRQGVIDEYVLSFKEIPEQRVTLDFNHATFGEMKAAADVIGDFLDINRRHTEQMKKYVDIATLAYSAGMSKVTATVIGIQPEGDSYTLLIDAYLDQEAANQEFQKMILMAILSLMAAIHLLLYIIGRRPSAARPQQSALVS
ncbi:hypothetical protein [Thaumasiovibrio subtropicus]|uniref:hypothetical protein n=1 Tax=Thaumasiovibrio subtropicus TaxID=1891207 RepID=UPI000B356F24|nr:hypothetical protein [Thaumasiovibrio subtropicus]